MKWATNGFLSADDPTEQQPWRHCRVHCLLLKLIFSGWIKPWPSLPDQAIQSKSQGFTLRIAPGIKQTLGNRNNADRLRDINEKINDPVKQADYIKIRHTSQPAFPIAA
jgi:hypothetical protein